MVKVDALDKKLIDLLQEDAGRSSDVIAKRLKVSAATVRRRIRRLVKNNVISIGAIVDPGKVELPLAAIIALDVTSDKLDSVMKALASRPEIIWVSTTTGQFDIISLARFPSTDELSRFVLNEMSKIEGIKDSETFICLHFESKRKHYTTL